MLIKRAGNPDTVNYYFLFSTRGRVLFSAGPRDTIFFCSSVDCYTTDTTDTNATVLPYHTSPNGEYTSAVW